VGVAGWFESYWSPGLLGRKQRIIGAADEEARSCAKMGHAVFED
jgi:hypothetical protein